MGTELKKVLNEETTPIQYIHHKTEYTDRTYLKGMVWKSGDVNNIPVSVANKMLKHIDLYAKYKGPQHGGDIVVEEVEESTDKQKEENLEEMRFQIENMSRKDTIVEFINTQWSIDVDKKGKSVVELREIANMHMDNLGLPVNDTL